MHPADCPEFEYSQHPRRSEVLSRCQAQLLTLIRAGHPQVRRGMEDTRPFHRLLFRELCPPGYEYFAGHYRGERFRCLQYLQVGIGGDPQVGAPPDAVSGQMADLAVTIRNGLAALDAAFEAPRAQWAQVDRTAVAVVLACRIFVQFLTIHPYANGNGHLARFCLIAILAHFGLGLKAWAIDPRPYPPYAELIARHRRGEPHLLESVVLKQCVPF